MVKQQMVRVSVVVFLLCGGMCATADVPSPTRVGQEEKVKEVPNPERMARQLTDEMDKALQLTEKQYKKLYKLNLKEQEERVEQMTGKRPTQGERPPMPPMGGGMPPMGGNRPPMRQEGMPVGAPNDDMQSRREKREKKLKKILTEEQYAKWQAIQAEREREMPVLSFPEAPER